MQGDDPPYLPVGTAVSAKYKGAFCEAKVSKVVHVVKCKVTYKMGLGTATISDEHVKGVLRVGQLVQAKHMDKKEYVDATISKIQDCSQYTVVFDDGDITTLRRTALCLKSGRHFNESETLDQLPLTHPEHFGNPVVGGRRGRRSRQAKEDSSEGEAEEENEPDLEVYTMEVGRVVCVEASDKKRNKDNWFPGLVVMPSAQPTVRINVKDEFLVRSFKDGRYYTVPQKEVTEFSRDMGAKIESTLAEAVEKAVKYLDSDELPVHWERTLLFNNLVQVATSESDDRCTDSSDDETPEEKDHFVAQLYKFMDDSNTPLNKSPMIGNKDVDLHRLFRVVRKLGGYNRVTNKNKWRSVTLRLKLTNNPSNYNQVKLVYKKFLLSFEAFHRTLGVTMLNHPRNAKKSRGRSLIRDKDRSTPVNSPKPEKEDEGFVVEKKEEEKVEEKPKPVKKVEPKVKEEEKKPEISDTNSSDAPEILEAPSTSTAKPKRIETKPVRERKIKPPTGEKVKAMVEKIEDQVKIEEKEEDKVIQQTRSKSQAPKVKEKEPPVVEKKVRDTKTPLPEMPSISKTPTKIIKKPEEEKKRGRKRFNTEEKTSASDGSTTDSSTIVVPPVNIGDKLKVYYGPTHESKVTYEAKIIEIDKEGSPNPMYLVHYTGWNTRYDEWIAPVRIAENLSATTKAKKLKQNATANKSATSKLMNKRGRRMSITGRSTIQDIPRSTTPSSVTSTSSRTKSPGTPVTRAFRSTRQGGRMRRASAHTDVSVHSESDSMGTESDSEIIKTSGGIKSEEGSETSQKKKLKHTLKDKRPIKDDDESEKEEEVSAPEVKPKRIRKLRKIVESKSTESDEDSGSPPKGRDFDLIQIRSELKGFVKAAALANTDASEKDAISSDDSINTTDNKLASSETDEATVKPSMSKSLSSEDIYEFKEPEPFEFETRTKLVDEKKKRLVPRIFDDVEKVGKKKKPGTPTKAEVKEELDIERKRLKLTPVKKPDSIVDEDETSNDSINRLHVEDPFDKLVESPSFHSGKEKPTGLTDNKPKAVKALNLDEPLSLFHDLSETAEDDSGDHLDISDTEDIPNEPLFTHKEQLFSESTFSKVLPERSTLDPIFRGFVPKVIDRKQKDSDDDDSIRASIQSVINQSSSTDEDSNDLLSINLPFSNYSESKVEKPKTPTITLTSPEPPEKDVKLLEQDKKKPDEKSQDITLPAPEISPALQETDSSLLESLFATKEILTKLDDTKDLIIKTSSKVADSLLQKMNLAKSPVDKALSADSDSEDDDKPIINIKAEMKQETLLAQKEEPKPKLETASKVQETKVESKPKLEIKAKPKVQESKFKASDKKPVELKVKSKPEPTVPESKKRARKIVSREFIEESDSDSDSTDSDERLVIARSDEESQTNSSFDIKLDTKESSNETSSADNAQASSDSSFKFSTGKKEVEPKVVLKPEVEVVKEEEPDSHLHSLLLCEETIPGSPAPAPEGPTVSESSSKTKSILEMPFASAPGTSNNSNKLELNREIGNRESKCIPKERARPPPLGLLIDNREKDVKEASTVLDNTPPMTPESTISNLSPRGDLSPNTADDSCKSGEGDGDYNMQRRGSCNKMSYSEDGSLDTLLNIESSTSSKKLEGASASTCRKRRKSCKTDDIPTKRGRKPLNRSRHTSDSDDNTYDVPEQSIMCNSSLSSGPSLDNRLTRSPKPSKYNFYIELDPSWDSAQRIAILQQKLQEIRKTYADVKTELAVVERRRKKLRRREREAKLSAKQEAVAT